MADAVSSWGFPWTVENVIVWQEGDVAWAQILGSVRTRRDGVEADVPYWSTGVFARGEDAPGRGATGAARNRRRSRGSDARQRTHDEGPGR